MTVVSKVSGRYVVGAASTINAASIPAHKFTRRATGDSKTLAQQSTSQSTKSCNELFGPATPYQGGPPSDINSNTIYT
jgi:hypothetical protein